MNNENKSNSLDKDFKKPIVNTDEEVNTFSNINSFNQKNGEELIGFFSLKGRSNRLEFFKIQSMIFLFMIINIFYFTPTASKEYITGFLIIYRLMTIAVIPLTVRRLHDSNLSGLYYIISLLPYGFSMIDNLFFDFITLAIGTYYLYLVLRTGDSHPNDYGIPNPPKKYGSRTINLICILLFILIVISGLVSN